jgi:hypothetical protein
LQIQYLTAPYLKFEVTNCMYKPVYTEFKKFPQLYFTGRPGAVRPVYTNSLVARYPMYIHTCIYVVLQPAVQILADIQPFAEKEKFAST